MSPAIQRNRMRAERRTGLRETHGATASRAAAASEGTQATQGVVGLPKVRTSERSTFKRCRWKWYFEFEETLKPTTDVPPLRFGSLIHKALADYYKPGIRRGPHPAARFRFHYDAELKQQEEFGFKIEDVEGDKIWTEAGTLGEAMLNNYVDTYGKDDEWEVLVTEQPFEQLVYREERTGEWPYSRKEPWFIYVGILDGIWRNRKTKKISIVDHKTAAAINVMYLALDQQATAYWTWGLDWIYEKGLLSPREKPAGMMYNHLRKAMPDAREFEWVGKKRVYLNLDGQYSKKQPAPYFARTPIYRDWSERERAREQVMAEFLDMELIRAEGERDGTSPPPEIAYKNAGPFTCPGCWLFDACEIHEMGGDWREMLGYTTRTWNPYEEHEVYAGETR